MQNEKCETKNGPKTVSMGSQRRVGLFWANEFVLRIFVWPTLMSAKSNTDWKSACSSWGSVNVKAVALNALNSVQIYCLKWWHSEFQFTSFASFRPNLIVATWCVLHLLSSARNDTFLCVGANKESFFFLPFHFFLFSVLPLRCQRRCLFFFSSFLLSQFDFHFVTNAIA